MGTTYRLPGTGGPPISTGFAHPFCVERVHFKPTTSWPAKLGGTRLEKKWAAEEYYLDRADGTLAKNSMFLRKRQMLDAHNLGGVTFFELHETLTATPCGRVLYRAYTSPSDIRDALERIDVHWDPATRPPAAAKLYPTTALLVNRVVFPGYVGAYVDICTILGATPRAGLMFATGTVFAGADAPPMIDGQTWSSKIACLHCNLFNDSVARELAHITEDFVSINDLPKWKDYD